MYIWFMTTATNLSSAATATLEDLRSNVEGFYTDHEGQWGSVYLDNLKVSGHSRAGLLSALADAGMYRPEDGHFGAVRMAS